jgi:biotin-(acetyl-CoA carboxylase) ligase
LEVVLAALARSLAERYEALQESSGPEVIVRDWSARSSYAQGRRVRVDEAGESFVGTTRGLERDGALRVETDDREVKVVRAGDVASVRASEG